MTRRTPPLCRLRCPTSHGPTCSATCGSPWVPRREPTRSSTSRWWATSGSTPDLVHPLVVEGRDVGLSNEPERGPAYRGHRAQRAGLHLRFVDPPARRSSRSSSTGWDQVNPVDAKGSGRDACGWWGHHPRSLRRRVDGRGPVRLPRLLPPRPVDPRTSGRVGAHVRLRHGPPTDLGSPARSTVSSSAPGFRAPGTPRGARDAGDRPGRRIGRRLGSRRSAWACSPRSPRSPA